MANAHHSRSGKELPKTWLNVSIGEVSDIVSGGTPRSNDLENFTIPGNGIAWVTPADLSGYTEKYISHGARDLSQIGYDSSSAKLIPTGSLLFSSRAPIGYIAIASNNISTNQGFKNFVFPKEIEPSYAYYFLLSIRELAKSLGTGTTFKEISGTTVKTLPFILAPLAEQKIIAAKLDSLFAQAENIKANLERIPDILKRFRESVLTNAVSGKLTEEWRKNNPFTDNPINGLPENKKTRRGLPEHVANSDLLTDKIFPKNWYVFPVATLLRKGVIIDLKDGNHGGNHPKKFEFTEEGIPFITASQIKDDGNIDYQSAPKISGKPLSKLKVGFAEPDDIIYSHKGTVGRVGINDRCCVLSPQTTYIRVNPKYIFNLYYAIMLQSSVFKVQVDAIKSQTTRDFVPISAHYSLFIVIPPLVEQFEIVRRVEELFTFIDNIEKKIHAALNRVNNLIPSILTKAFNGELTADWRSANLNLISGENSAEALLRKIKMEREALKKQPKSTRITAKKKIGECMSKQPLKVVEALKQAGGPLSGQQLLAVAGYPSDSDTEMLEAFFLDIRKSLNHGSIIQLERDSYNQDWFELAESIE